MTEPDAGPPRGAVCPYLGRSDDPETYFTLPHLAHRCHTTAPPSPIDEGDQLLLCFAAGAGCRRFVPLGEDGRRAPPVVVAPSVDDVREGESAGAEQPTDKQRRQPSQAGAIPNVSRWTTDQWTVAAVVGTLIIVVAYFGLLAVRGQARTAALPTPVPGVRDRALALLSTATPTSAPRPTFTPAPTRVSMNEPAATVPLPTLPEGGLFAALSPSERGVATFNDGDQLPQYGARNLHAGRYEDQRFLGAIQFPLSRIPADSRVSSARLELAGFSDALLTGPGQWRVEVLKPEVDADWSNLTFATFDQAPAESLPDVLAIDYDDLAPRAINVLELPAEAVGMIADRLEAGAIAFRVRGPAAQGDNLFTWDTGYGEGFGTRPVLRVGFVPPPPTPGPAPGEPTVVPLLIPVVEPTPAATATPLPSLPPALLIGKILFTSDRFGRTTLMAYDPANEALWQVTQAWPVEIARRQQTEGSQYVISVAGRPCGGAATTDAQGRKVLVDPNDPARRCTTLVLHDKETTEQREIAPPGFIHYDPVLSPDGQWVAYVSDMAGNDEIFKIRVDGSENTPLTDNDWAWDKHPSWSPDGSRIVFWSNREGRQQLYVMDADGANVENLSRNAHNDWDPIWVR